MICDRFDAYKLEDVAEISMIQLVEMLKYLKTHPVPQAEMVEVKRTPGTPPPNAPPNSKGVETNHETTSPANMEELTAMLGGQ